MASELKNHQKIVMDNTNRASTNTINATITNQNYQKQLTKDIESKKSRFCWKLIGKYHVPCIIRFINDECLEFVSTRIVETQILRKLKHYLHPDIFKCSSINSDYITRHEAKLLNDINQNHANCAYGKEMFLKTREHIVLFEEVYEFYRFLKACYRLLSKKHKPRQEKCGFLRINKTGKLLPYFIKDEQKYVPLFCLQREIDNHQSINLKNWDLAFLKFCFLVQGTKAEFSTNSCKVTSFENIKNDFPQETIFEDYWPPMSVYSHLLTNHTHVNPPENTIPHILTAPAPAPFSCSQEQPSTFHGYYGEARNQSLAVKDYNQC